MKILLDTNIYLDFYRSSELPKSIIDLLEKNISSIILPEQVVKEFERSRENVLIESRNKFKSESNILNFASSFLLNKKEFKLLSNAKKQYDKARATVIEVFDRAIDEQDSDQFYSFFKDLQNKSAKNGNLFSTTDIIIEKAEIRKKIGNPPVSDKYTIGDEIIWETILENIDEDLIIVGRDNTFTKNFTFLKDEFHQKNGRLLYLYRKITEAFDKLGVEVTPEAKTEESKTILSISKDETAS